MENAFRLVKKTLNHIFILFFIVASLCFFSTTGVIAADLPIGAECQANADCRSGDCESSQNDGKSYCDCDDDNACTDEYTEQPGEQWDCKDGAYATYDLDYCVSNLRGVKYPIDPRQSSLTDQLLDPHINLDEIQNATGKPVTRISIPGVSFSDVKIQEDPDGTFLYIPFLGEYIAAIYKYLIMIMGIISVIIIIVAGLRWTLSGGDSGSISEAKKMIGNALIGIVLAAGSYTILYTVNPSLVDFSYLKVRYINTKNIEDLFFNKETDFNLNIDVSNTDLDNLFKGYAACYGYDWRVLKAFAAAESGLDVNARRPGSQYHGLFQMNYEYCQGGLGYGKFPASLGFDCTSRIDAETNTATAAATIQINLSSIQKKCPGISVKDAMTLLYVGHNNGPSVMAEVLRGRGCTQPAIRNGVQAFYVSRGGNNNGVTTEHGLKKHDYGEQKVIATLSKMGLGDQTPIYPSNAKDDALCPAKTGKRILEKGSVPGQGNLASARVDCPNGNGKKILAVGDSNTESNTSYADIIAASCANIIVDKRGFTGRSAAFVYDQIKNKNLKREGFTDIIVWAGVNDINNAQSGLRRIYQKAKANDLRVIAVVVTPWKGYDSWRPALQEKTDETNTWIRQLGGGALDATDVVIDVYNLFEDPNNQDALNTLYSSDKIHLNKQAQELLAERITNAAF